MHAASIIMYCSYFKNKILEAIALDQNYAQVTEGLQQENVLLNFKDYRFGEDGILLFRDKFYFTNTQELRNLVLKEVNNVPYVGHQGYQKTIEVVRSHYL
jgi:hypothetical protein